MYQVLRVGVFAIALLFGGQAIAGQKVFKPYVHGGEAERLNQKRFTRLMTIVMLMEDLNKSLRLDMVLRISGSLS